MSCWWSMTAAPMRRQRSSKTSVAPIRPCGCSDWRGCRGKGAAVRHGMQSAVGSLQLFADADGATPIEEFARLERALAEGCGHGHRLSGAGLAAPRVCRPGSVPSNTCLACCSMPRFVEAAFEGSQTRNVASSCFAASSHKTYSPTPRSMVLDSISNCYTWPNSGVIASPRCP